MKVNLMVSGLAGLFTEVFMCAIRGGVKNAGEWALIALWSIVAICGAISAEIQVRR